MRYGSDGVKLGHVDWCLVRERLGSVVEDSQKLVVASSM